MIPATAGRFTVFTDVSLGLTALRHCLSEITEMDVFQEITEMDVFWK